MPKSEGEASRILEEGKATATAIEMMRGQWEDGEIRDLFLIELMPELLDKVTSVVAKNLRVDKLTILDGGDGNGMPNYVHNLTQECHHHAGATQERHRPGCGSNGQTEIGWGGTSAQRAILTGGPVTYQNP